MTNLNKKALVDIIADTNDMKKVQAEAALNAVLDGLFAAISTMEAGDKLQLLGDLTFEVKHVEERTFVNPLKRAKEGIIEEVTKPAHNKLVVYAGSNFQSAVN